MGNEPAKDCCQTAIPSVTMNEVAGASPEEKSQGVLSDTLGPIDFTKDVNVRDVSAAASTLLDINCQRPVKGNVSFSPPIPSHVVISKHDNKGASGIDANKNMSNIIGILSNSGQSSNSNHKTSHKSNDTNEKSIPPNGSEKNSDENDGIGNEDEEFHKDFKQKSDSFAKALSQHMSKKVSITL